MRSETKKISELSRYIALLAILGITVHLACRFFIPACHLYSNIPLFVVLLFGGGPLVFDLLRKAVALEFGSDLLAGLSIVTAILLEEYLAGAFVVLMLSGGEAIENYAVRTASRVLDALAKRAPTTAHRKRNGAIEEIRVGEIAVGDVILIFPHEICPVDGNVIEGNGIMDESYLTGEPFFIPKAPGSPVLSGAINGEASLTIEATRLAEDSRYAKIMQVMRETEQKRPRIRRLADQLGAWYTPFALLIAIAAWSFSGDPVRFLAVLVIATPCPLLIAIPVAIIGSISLCASRGILIKNPVVLEQLEQCRTMIFDKTGTLTYGQPILSEQRVDPRYDPKDILQLVASVERYSKHPLAIAVIQKAEKDRIPLLDAAEISEPPGKGLRGIVKGREVIITSRRRAADLPSQIEWPSGEGLGCAIVLDGHLVAYYRFRDAPRPESRSFVQHLASKHGYTKLILLSGDRKEEVQYFAESVGISEVYGEQSPEQKVEIVMQEVKKAKTAYLGDGINDAPALIAATVGIAFGQNSDITAEAAGAVVLESSLEHVDEFLHISRRMRHIALQSALGGMGLSILGMLVAAGGYLPPVAGAISQEVIDFFAVMNALRTIWRPKNLADLFSGKEHE